MTTEEAKKIFENGLENITKTNRLIEFRGKHKNTKEWVYGYYAPFFDEDTLEIIPAIISLSAERLDIYPVIPETVGQYTGITDKNGKKIFEDDILRIGYCFGWDSEQEKKVPEEEYISKVYSIDACPFCVDLQHCDGDMSPVAWLDWSYDDTEIEVIGNIHDNPELLKGDENNV